METNSSKTIKFYATFLCVINIILSLITVFLGIGMRNLYLIIISIVAFFMSFVIKALFTGFAEIIEFTNATKHNTEDLKHLLYKSDTFENAVETIKKQEQNKNIISLDDIEFVSPPLTKDGINKLSDEILNASSDWWSKSPGLYSDTALYVKANGNVVYYGTTVDVLNGVRPVLALKNSVRLNINLYDLVQVQGTNDLYYYIGNDNENRYILLSKDVIKDNAGNPFLIPFKVDKSTNNYDESDLYDFITSWAKEWYSNPVKDRDRFLSAWNEEIKKRKISSCSKVDDISLH